MVNTGSMEMQNHEVQSQSEKTVIIDEAEAQASLKFGEDIALPAQFRTETLHLDQATKAASNASLTSETPSITGTYFWPQKPYQRIRDKLNISHNLNQLLIAEKILQKRLDRGDYRSSVRRIQDLTKSVAAGGTMTGLFSLLTLGMVLQEFSFEAAKATLEQLSSLYLAMGAMASISTWVNLTIGSPERHGVYDSIPRISGTSRANWILRALRPEFNNEQKRELLETGLESVRKEIQAYRELLVRTRSLKVFGDSAEIELAPKNLEEAFQRTRAKIQNDSTGTFDLRVGDFSDEEMVSLFQAGVFNKVLGALNNHHEEIISRVFKPTDVLSLDSLDLKSTSLLQTYIAYAQRGGAAPATIRLRLERLITTFEFYQAQGEILTTSVEEVDDNTES